MNHSVQDMPSQIESATDTADHPERAMHGSESDAAGAGASDA